DRRCEATAGRGTPVEASGLVDPFRRSVPSGLMEDKLGHCSGGVHLEGDLGVDDFQEVLLLSFCEQLEFWLSGGLHKEVVAFARYGQDEVWRQLIAARVLVEQLRIDGDLFALLG